MKLDLLVIDDFTRRQVWRDPETGRMYTRRREDGDAELREVDTVTIRRMLDGSTTLVVAYTDPSEDTLTAAMAKQPLHVLRLVK